MIGYYILGPLGLAVFGLSTWSLFNAWRNGRIRSHGWIRRDEQPGFFWFMVVATLFAATWFGFIGALVSADMIGLIR